MRKYYTAVLFQERADLHMTLTHHGKKDQEGVDVLTKLSEKIVTTEIEPEQFVLFFDQVRMFGYQRNVRVLCPSDICQVPQWLRQLAPATWQPHIATDHDDELHLVARSLAVMHKKSVIWEYKL